MKLTIFVIIIIVIAVAGFWFINSDKKVQAPTIITNFTECVEAGNPVMESYPRQCTTEDGQSFTEYIGNELEKIDLIRLTSPRPNNTIESPLTVTGEARGYWFFEASFPVSLVNWDGLIIAEGIATAEGEWMTEDFVPFKATLEFSTEEGSVPGIDNVFYKNNGTLILQKDNPSGLPEHDDALEIPIFFKKEVRWHITTLITAH